METTGKVNGISRDYMTGKIIVALQIDSNGSEELEKICKLEKLSVKLARYSEKRSLNANAYFHVLLSRMAEILRLPMTAVKNQMIRDYGAFEIIDGQIPTFLQKAVYEEQTLNREDIHVKPIGREWKDDCEWVRFAWMRGSHTYNTQEMSRLIDGTVQEAKDLGIETLPPAEIERMKKAWNSTTKG